jgi:outer membrane immunogenic protein
MKRRFLLVSLVLAGGVQAVSAADLPLKAPPPAPVYNWTGFYVGANVGGGWGNQAVNFSGSAATLAAIAIGQVPASLAGSPSGVIGGAQAGYNFQSGRFVYGIEADIQGANIHSGATLSTAVAGGPFPVTTTADQNLSYFGTVRGRAGFTAMPALLLYGTGGFAYGGASVASSTFTTPACPGFCGSAANSTVLTGWTAGAGAEYAFSRNWTAKLEYLYYDLGSISQIYTDNLGRFAGTNVTTNTAFRGNIVRVGVNYKFGGPVVAKY